MWGQKQRRIEALEKRLAAFETAIVSIDRRGWKPGVNAAETNKAYPFQGGIQLVQTAIYRGKLREIGIAARYNGSMSDAWVYQLPDGTGDMYVLTIQGLPRRSYLDEDGRL